MKYSKKEIGQELQKELDKGYDTESISNWADALLYNKFKSDLHLK